MTSFSGLEDSEIKNNVQDSDNAFMLFFFNLDYSRVFLGFFCSFGFFNLFFSVIKQMTFIFHVQHSVTNFVSATDMFTKTITPLPKCTLK